MKKTSKTTKTSGKTRIVFFGNERIATGVTTLAPTFQALVDNGYEVAAVVSNYEKGHSRNARHLEIEKVASEHGVPVLLPTRPADILNQLRSFGAEAAILVAYGKIVPQSVIDIFPKGIINIHPSLLPLHRGPTPLESVMLAGDKKTGVSLMRLVKAMDAGPVYAQSEILLSGNERKQELADTLLDIGSSMVIELLPGILEGTVVPLPQDDSRATYDRLLSKDDGVINWSKTAEQIEREVRVFEGWPKSRTEIAGKDVIITEAHAAPLNHPGYKPGEVNTTTEPGMLKITCGEGCLVIDKLKPAGKNEMTTSSFLAGYGHLLEK